MNKIEQQWTEKANKQLKGRTIVAVRYLTDKEIENMGWEQKCLVLQLDDGNLIFPSMDDEGNGPGSLFTNHETDYILPII
jgi:hypothetical protein